MWRRHSDIDSPQEAARLSVTAVKNASIDMLRHRASHTTEQINESSATVDAGEEDEEERDEVLKRVTTIIEARLSEKQRDILKMRDMEDMPFAEIARRMDMTEENVRMTLSRARKIVRTIYQNMNYD